MALQLSGDIAGLGKIVQIVRATDSTNRTTTSTSFVDASISVTITPKKSDSAVLLVWAVQARHTGTSDSVKVQITDSSNNAISGAEYARVGSNTTSDALGFITQIGYATPATTSATTYKGRFAVETSGTGQLINSNGTGQMFAIEVAA